VFSSDSSSADASSADVSSSDAASSSADHDAQILFKTAMEEMPAELKDLLGLGLTQEFNSFSQAVPVQRSSSTPNVDQESNSRSVSTDDAASTDDATDDDDEDDDDAANDSEKPSDDNNSADGDDDDSDGDDVEDVLDSVLNGDDTDSEVSNEEDTNEDDEDDQTEQVRKSEDSKPFVVEIEENNLDGQSMGAVLNAVADKLNIAPQDMEVVEKMAAADSGADDDSSVKAWQQAGATSVETAHHESSPDSEAVKGEEQAAYASAKLDAMVSDNNSDETQSEQARSLEKDVVLARLEALESRLQ